MQAVSGSRYFSRRKIREGWHVNVAYPEMIQKTNGRVVVYVSYILWGYKLQLYHRGNINVCEFEVRTENQTQEGLDMLFDMGEKWLVQYSDGNLERMKQNPYSINNPDGVWSKDNHKHKLYWI